MDAPAPNHPFTQATARQPRQPPPHWVDALGSPRLHGKPQKQQQRKHTLRNTPRHWPLQQQQQRMRTVCNPDHLPLPQQPHLQEPHQCRLYRHLIAPPPFISGLPPRSPGGCPPPAVSVGRQSRNRLSSGQQRNMAISVGQRRDKLSSGRQQRCMMTPGRQIPNPSFHLACIQQRQRRELRLPPLTSTPSPHCRRHQGTEEPFEAPLWL